MSHMRESLLTLVTQTSTNLPPDVRRAIKYASVQEEAGSRAALALRTIVDNVVAAEQDVAPICQDTGMPTFFVRCPVGFDQLALEEDIRWAVAEATRLGMLRPNSVDPVTGRNTGDNLGPGTPVVHFAQWRESGLEVRLMLKGGGSENQSAQYSLPAELPGLGKAGRDLDGIRKTVLHAVWQAQGQGCSAGFVGVGIGSDRTSGMELAKEQLLRDLEDANPDPALAELERYIVEKANALDIGTMGFGGHVTLLGCKVAALNRIPASFFVSVAYNCWAFRRLGVVLDPETGEISRWLYRDRPEVLASAGGFPTEGAKVLRTPISEEDVRALHVGDVVLLRGRIHTGRDELHKYLMQHEAPVPLEGGAIYHCGPVMLKDEDGRWHVGAAGPTTSSREEPYQADIIAKYGLRAIVGKGGMGARTLAGLERSGAVYLSAIGGAAQYYAKTVREVAGVDFLDLFGVPEAMWHLDVEDFPAIVTMDAHGQSLHKDVLEQSRLRLEDLKDPVF